MDLSFLKYDIKNEMMENQYSWQEILFALENHIIKTEDVINYAIYILNEDILGFDIVLDMTSLYTDDNIYPYVKSLIQLEEKQECSKIKDRWLYLILKWLYENKDEFTNTIEVVEELYEQFDFPEHITSFVRYMPSDTGDLGSLDLNRRILFDNWKKYLTKFEELENEEQ